MSTWAAFWGFLAIETRLQLLDRGARQHQGVVIENVVDVRADRRDQVDLAKVRRSLSEADAERVAVDDQSLPAEIELGEPLLDHFGLGLADVEILDDDQPAVLRLGGERHAQAERADL